MRKIICLMLLPVFLGCGTQSHEKNTHKESKITAALNPKNVEMSCDIKFQQFWATKDSSADLMPTLDNVIYNGKFTSVLEDGLELDLYAGNQDEMVASKNDLANSPNINNFKVNVSVSNIEDECEFNDGKFYLSLGTHIVVRDLPRNLTNNTKSCIDFREATKKIDFEIWMSFGPERLTTGFGEMTKYDFQTLPILNSESPAVIFNFSCELRKKKAS